MASSRRVHRVEVQEELYLGLLAEATRGETTAQALTRALLRGALITLRRRREGSGDPVALVWAEGCVRETAARRYLQDWGILGLDGALVEYTGASEAGEASPSGRGR